MACETFRTPNGIVVACGRKRRAACQVPNCGRPHEKLCDFQVCAAPSSAGARTCDMKLCRAHAKSVGPDRDFCPAHAERR